MATRQVRVIPANTNNYVVGATAPKLQKKKVAAYCRVSTDSEEQQSSYDAQVDYYTNYINQKHEWELVSIYADEGLSGTSTKKRDDFNRMIRDAMDGKIEYIITKSISRFARNTLDCLTYVRQLKEKGVGIFFEKENINTLDSKGEVLLTILSSLAQDEIRNLSENVAWGKRKRFADGKVFIPTAHFLGFTKDDTGNVVIDDKQAKVVRRIYKLFLEGKTPHYIQSLFEAEKIKAPGGGDRWHSGTIVSILQNEKYMGDALLQKRYVADFLTKKSIKNDGVLPQYYVENSHPAIISKEVYNMAQQEFKNRKTAKTGKYNSSTPLSGKIICGNCGSYFGSKVWHSTSKYKKTIWRCNDKYREKGNKKCDLMHLNESDITNAFVEIFNNMFECKALIIENLQIAISDAIADNKIARVLDALQNEVEKVEMDIKKLIDKNATTKMNQDAYVAEYEILYQQHQALQVQIQAQKDALLKQTARRENARIFLDRWLEIEKPLTEFNETLWNVMVENVVVNDGSILFKFKDGSKIEKNI